MPSSSEVLIALAAGDRVTSASAFDTVGSELAAVRVSHGRAGASRYDPTEAWQGTRLALCGLADRVPDLARRTLALAVTGAAHPLVAIDEDGDPLPAGSSTLDGAARLLPAKDWIAFCLTGVALTDPVGRRLVAGAHEIEQDSLLPAAIDEGAELRLGRAASAACRLCGGLPTILAPPETISAALALGALEPEPKLAYALLEEHGSYLVPEPGPGGVGGALPIDLPFAAGTAWLVAHVSAGWPFAWLLDLLQEALAEIGLIGTGAAEIGKLLAARVEAAPPGRVVFNQVAGPSVGRLEGLCKETDLGELARSLIEGAGLAARRMFLNLGRLPRELRIAGAFAAQPNVQGMLAACLDAQVRTTSRSDAATAGAGLFAALALDVAGSAREACRSWVDPFLAPSVAPDQALTEVYSSLCQRLDPTVSSRGSSGADRILHAGAFERSTARISNPPYRTSGSWT